MLAAQCARASLLRSSFEVESESGPLKCPSTHASFCVHLCIFRQAGQRNGTSIQDDKDSNTIVSVVSPVLTGTFSVGQLVMISAIACPPARNHQEYSIPIMPRRHAVGTPIFFCAQCGVGTPAGYGISQGSPCGIGSKGANQRSDPAPLHTRRLQNAQSDPDQNPCDRQQKAPAGKAGARLNPDREGDSVRTGRSGVRGRKRLTLGSALRQADDACLTSPRHH